MNKEDQALLLSPYLAAYFDRRDKALGFVQPSFMTRESVSYYHATLQAAEKEVIKAMVKVATLETIQARIKAIVTEAQGATPKRKQELLDEARKLKKQAKKING